MGGQVGGGHGGSDRESGIPSRPRISRPEELLGSGENIDLQKAAVGAAVDTVVKAEVLTSAGTSTVLRLGFADSLGPAAQALFAFHDLLFSVLLPILVGVLLQLLIFLFRHPSYRFLLDCQPIEFL